MKIKFSLPPLMAICWTSKSKSLSNMNSLSGAFWRPYFWKCFCLAPSHPTSTTIAFLSEHMVPLLLENVTYWLACVDILHATGGLKILSMLPTPLFIELRYLKGLFSLCMFEALQLCPNLLIRFSLIALNKPYKFLTHCSRGTVEAYICNYWVSIDPLVVTGFIQGG